MSAHQFSRVGIALLRHDGTARRPCVGQADETIRLRRPYDHFFGQPRQMKRRLCGGRKELKREVAVGNRVQTVRHGAVKAKRQCRCGAINWKGCPRKCGRAQGGLVQPAAAIGKAAAIALCHFIIGHQVVAERHRLGDLQMREARHDAIGMFFCPCHERRLECAQASIDFIGRIAHPKAEVGGDLVISRPRGVQTCRWLTHQST